MSTTSFEGMPHVKLIAWLDQANSEAVKAVADRLASAATEIDKIGEELKIRPQIVEWKGQGAESFRTWSADLANATLRLGLYSKGASTQLSHAADAIALAKAATPRPQGDPESTIKAALQNHNDPDATALVRKLTGEREVAAAEMRKLSQTYSQSVEGFGKLEKPEFPPPPRVIAPDTLAEKSDTSKHMSGGGSAGGAVGAHAGSSSTSVGGHGAVGGVATPSSTHASVPAPVTSVVRPPVDMGIDSVATLPTTAPPNPVLGPSVTPGPGKPDAFLATPAVLPPVIGGGPQPTKTGGRTTGIPRPPLPPGNEKTGVSPAGRPSRDGGIVGGRPAAQTSGRLGGGLPRGTVIGGEGTHAGRGVMGSGAGMGGVGSGGQSGIVGGRRLAGETGGMVGGRPQQPGRTSVRPFTPGGTGLVRGAGGQTGRGGAATPQRAGEPRSDERERLDYLVEDEETWQRGSRRVVPPVID
ncbi:WXG100 family type VII secretion target [Streptomyces sp. NPDC056154]|uniref:WXG100 family type VII secretion target n=1 Tax=unclassified Streptomyces TaxID=2593676 RepID=UPI0035D7C0D4